MGYYEDRPMREVEEEYTGDRKESKIPLDYQSKSLSEMHEYLDLLSGKLRPVLTPSLPTDENAEMTKAEETMQSPITGAVVKNNSSIQLAIRKIRHLIDRVEC